MKKLIILTFLVLCVVAALVGTRLVSKTRIVDDGPTSSRTFPVSNPTRSISPTTPANTLSKQSTATTSATITRVQELLSDQTVSRILAGATDLHDDGIYKLKDDPRYEVFLIAHAKYFAVRLKETVSDELLSQVGLYLSTTLNLSQEDLCRLDIDVFSPASYDPSQSQDIGLPACPGPREPSNGR